MDDVIVPLWSNRVTGPKRVDQLSGKSLTTENVNSCNKYVFFKGRASGLNNVPVAHTDCSEIVLALQLQILK